MAIASLWVGTACISEACGPPCEYRDTPKILAALVSLFEKLHIAHCSEKGKYTAFAVGWPLLWAVKLATMPS